MDTDQRLLENYIRKHTKEALGQIEILRAEEIAALLESIQVELAIILLSQLDRFKSARSLEKVAVEKAILLVDKLPISRSETLLRLMDNTIRNTLLEGMSEQTSKSLSRILKYPDNTVGAYMKPDVCTLPADIKVSEALNMVRKNEFPVVQHLFILERDQKLTGILDLQDLISVDNNLQIRSIMNPDPPRILADRNIENFIKGNEWIEPYSSLAVVDVNGIFLGVMTREVLSQISFKQKTFNQQALQAGNALGDLYRIGLSGLLQSLMELTSQVKTK